MFTSELAVRDITRVTNRQQTGSDRAGCLHYDRAIGYQMTDPRSVGRLMPSDGRPWRVFLSHTSELREHPSDRSYVAAAEAAVMRAGHAVSNMAYFAARDSEPAAYCTAEVERADVFVGIIGLRYGATVRGRPEVSYTELEFEAATAAGIPRLILLVKDDAAGLPVVDQPDEHRNMQEAFRRRLQEAGLTVGTVNSPADLEIGLYQALTELRRPRVTQGIVVATETARPSSLSLASPPSEVPTNHPTSLALNPRFMPDRRWLIKEIVARLADRHGIARLANQIEARLGRSGIAAETVQAWRSGQGGPPPGDVLTVILQLAGEDEELASRVDMLIGQRPEQGYAKLDDMDRRRLLQWVVGAAAISSVAPDLERLAWMLAAPGYASTRPIDDLEMMTHELEQRCWTIAPATLLPSVRTHLTLVTGLVARQTPSRHRARLHAIAGSTAALAAWLSFLLKNYGEAHSYCQIGEAFGREIGYDSLHGHLLVIRSDLYAGVAEGHQGGNSTAAITLLEQAEAAVDTRSHPHLQTWLLACRAESRAMLGDEVGANRDLDAAERALASAAPRPAGFFNPWDCDRLAGFRGSCALALCRANDAVAILSSALERTPSHFTERPAVLADLAAAHAKKGEVERACTCLSEAASLARDLGHIGHIHRILASRHGLDSWRSSPEVRRLDEELALTQTIAF